VQHTINSDSCLNCCCLRCVAGVSDTSSRISSGSSGTMAEQLHSSLGRRAAFAVAGAACDGQTAALIITDLKLLVQEGEVVHVDDVGTEPDSVSTAAAAAAAAAAATVDAHSEALPCANECPHITLCTAPGVPPRHSNAMLQCGAYELLQLNSSGVQLTGTITLRLRDRLRRYR
jgi:Fungal tRNA ligase phosphodiesterase domain